MVKVLYPGSFDPFHNGHLEIISTASRLFDEVVVAAMRNPQKGTPMFTASERVQMIEDSVRVLENVSVVGLDKLVVQLAAELDIDMIVKGLRGVSDFDVELQRAQRNRAVSGIQTIFIPSTTEDSYIASKYIRDIARFGGDVTEMIPKPVADLMAEKLAK